MVEGEQKTDGNHIRTRITYHFSQVHYEYGTLDQQEMADDEFAGGLSVVEVFGDNIVDFQKIMKIVADINANAMPLAA